MKHKTIITISITHSISIFGRRPLTLKFMKPRPNLVLTSAGVGIICMELRFGCTFLDNNSSSTTTHFSFPVYAMVSQSASQAVKCEEVLLQHENVFGSYKAFPVVQGGFLNDDYKNVCLESL